MRSLKKLNAAAGTKFTRWSQVVAFLTEEPYTVDKFDGKGEHAYAPVTKDPPKDKPQGRECKMPWWTG